MRLEGLFEAIAGSNARKNQHPRGTKRSSFDVIKEGFYMRLIMSHTRGLTAFDDEGGFFKRKSKKGAV
jgi:hypothetical protein